MDGESVVGQYLAPHEAELAASYLREHGLSARVENDVLQSMNPLWGMALGGVRVYVPSADADEAKALLADLLQQVPSRSDPSDRTLEFDAAARRALAAAVVGLFLLPVVAQLYSLVVVLKLRSAQLSARGRRHRIFALAIDLVVLGLCALWLAT